MNTKRSLSDTPVAAPTTAKAFALLIFAVALIFSTSTLFAQVKVGDNPTSINAGSVMELESTNKGLLMPRIPLTNTTTWGLLGTAAAGMHVYNTNIGITSTNTTYPTLDAKIGEYYWDGTGWVALAAVGSQSTPVQLKMYANQQILANNTANNTITFSSATFDVGGNKVGNTVVIPSSGLYDLSAYAVWATTGGSGGGWGLRLFVNNVFNEQFNGGILTYNVVDAGSGRIVTRLNAGDVLSIIMVTGQAAGTFTLYAQSSFTAIKLSN